jgi:hypothetical protein
VVDNYKFIKQTGVNLKIRKRIPFEDLITTPVVATVTYHRYSGY